MDTAWLVMHNRAHGADAVIATLWSAVKAGWSGRRLKLFSSGEVNQDGVMFDRVAKFCRDYVIDVQCVHLREEKAPKHWVRLMALESSHVAISVAPGVLFKKSPNAVIKEAGVGGDIFARMDDYDDRFFVYDWWKIRKELKTRFSSWSIREMLSQPNNNSAQGKRFSPLGFLFFHALRFGVNAEQGWVNDAAEFPDQPAALRFYSKPKFIAACYVNRAGLFCYGSRFARHYSKLGFSEILFLVRDEVQQGKDNRKFGLYDECVAQAGEEAVERAIQDLRERLDVKLIDAGGSHIGRSSQYQDIAYGRVAREYSARGTWILNADVDEFLVLPKDYTLDFITDAAETHSPRIGGIAFADRRGKFVRPDEPMDLRKVGPVANQAWKWLCRSTDLFATNMHPTFPLDNGAAWRRLGDNCGYLAHLREPEAPAVVETKFDSPKPIFHEFTRRNDPHAQPRWLIDAPACLYEWKPGGIPDTPVLSGDEHEFGTARAVTEHVKPNRGANVGEVPLFGLTCPVPELIRRKEYATRDWRSVGIGVRWIEVPFGDQIPEVLNSIRGKGGVLGQRASLILFLNRLREIADAEGLKWMATIEDDAVPEGPVGPEVLRVLASKAQAREFDAVIINRRHSEFHIPLEEVVSCPPDEPIYPLMKPLVNGECILFSRKALDFAIKAETDGVLNASDWWMNAYVREGGKVGRTWFSLSRQGGYKSTVGHWA